MKESQHPNRPAATPTSSGNPVEAGSAFPNPLQPTRQQPVELGRRRHQHKRIRDPELRQQLREHRRRRLRRHGRRAYIRSVYFLPSMATLGNAICGFASMYVASLDRSEPNPDAWTTWFQVHNFVAAAYLILIAMLFDALDGRLARFTRHTTDFGGQLDSLADVISFGCAPAFLALHLFKAIHPEHWPWAMTVPGIPPMVSRLVWAIGALYVSCAALRLARFNVSNAHGEQHHFSFLGLPSPGAGGAIAALVLMQQDLSLAQWHNSVITSIASSAACACVWCLPIVVLATGLLMISNVRYPHLVNRYLRGRRSIGRLILVLAFVLLFLVAHRYVLAIGMVLYALMGPASMAYARLRNRGTKSVAA